MLKIHQTLAQYESPQKKLQRERMERLKQLNKTNPTSIEEARAISKNPSDPSLKNLQKIDTSDLEMKYGKSTVKKIGGSKEVPKKKPMVRGRFLIYAFPLGILGWAGISIYMKSPKFMEKIGYPYLGLERSREDDKVQSEK